jgi:hypothetical protein
VSTLCTHDRKAGSGMMYKRRHGERSGDKQKHAVYGKQQPSGRSSGGWCAVCRKGNVNINWTTCYAHAY